MARSCNRSAAPVTASAAKGQQQRLLSVVALCTAQDGGGDRGEQQGESQVSE